MESLVYNYNDEVYAVIDRHDYVVGVLDDFDDACDFAEENGYSCVETWKNYDGYEGQVVDEYWIEEMIEPNFWKQRIYALIMIFISAATIPALEGDATFAVLMIPVMIYMLFSKQYWLID